MKKNLFLSFLTVFVLFSCGEKPGSSGKTVHLNGQLVDMGSTDVRMSYNGASSLLGNSRDILLITDEQGYFDTTFVLSEPAYFNISRNTLYLSPGDELTVTITNNNREAEFSGTSALVNRYMKERLFPKGGSFLESGANVTGDFITTKATIDSLAAIRLHQLDTLSEGSDEFKRLEAARIKADVINSYFSYSSYAGYIKSRRNLDFDLPERGVLLEMMAPYVTKSLHEINDPLFLDVAVVRDLFSLSNDSTLKGLFFAGVDIPERSRELFAASREVRKLSSDITPEIADEVGEFAQSLQNRDFAEEINNKLAQVSKLFAGQPAIDFELTDANGVSKWLSDFKGKVLYVDLWATWCGPCLQEAPFYESLAQQYSPDDVVFLPISTDKDRKVWTSYLEKNPKEIAQYHSTDNILQEGWSVQSIPRFLLIDRDFKIASAFAPRPSSEEAKQAIDRLITR